MPRKQTPDDEQTDDTTARAKDAGEAAADDTAAGETGAGAGVTLSRTELERLRRKLWDRFHSGLSR
jgi:hypothetical protein